MGLFTSASASDTAFLAATVIGDWVLPSLSGTSVQSSRWQIGRPISVNVPETPAAALLGRAMKYWRSGVADVGSRQQRSVSSLDAVNVGLLWAGGLRDDARTAEKARTHFAALVHAAVGASGPLEMEAQSLSLICANAIFSSVSDRTLVGLPTGSVGQFATRLRSCVETKRMLADSDFVPHILVAESIGAARRYFAFADKIFGK